MNRWRVGEDIGSKETDRCPLTLPPLQSMASQCVKTARRLPGPRSTLVKGIESKVAALIWHAALGCLRWNSAIFGFAWIFV
jgi:hypothetical protein